MKFTSWTAGTGVLFCAPLHIHSCSLTDAGNFPRWNCATAGHDRWLSYPKSLPPSDPARNLFLPTTKKLGCPYRCWENLFFPEISFCTRSIFNPFRCLIHMQSKWSFQPVKWEALCLLKFLIWISCFVLELSIWTVLPWLSFLTHLSDVWPHSLTPLSLIRVEQSLSCDKWNGENCSLKIYSV